MAKKDESKNMEEKSVTKSEDVLNSFFISKEYEKLHYNFDVDGGYKISSGSLILDDMIGLMEPCVFRLIGASGGGKTSATLSYMFDFLTKVKKSKGLYFKGEGRLSDNIKRASGITFIESGNDEKENRELYKQWKEGTCFICRSNVGELVYSLIEGLVDKNESDEKFFFVIDSTDSIILEAEKAKAYSDPSKVAAGASLASLALKRLSLKLSSKGHYLFVISQQREANLKIGYTAETPQLKTNSSGGHALIHFPEIVLEFFPKIEGKKIYETTKILESGPTSTKDPSKNGKQIGHMARGKIIKCGTEEMGNKFEYPVLYKRKGGSSVWTEREVFAKMVYDGFFEIRGAGWVTPSENLLSILAHYDLPVLEKTQGVDALFNKLIERGDVIPLFERLFKREISEKNSENGYIIGQEID